MSEKTKQMLAAMLNGKPTKELEYVKALGTSDISKGTQSLKESVNNSNLISAEELNYTPEDMKKAGKNALPPVSLDQITNLMAGKKTPSGKPAQPQQIQKPLIQEDYYAIPDLPKVVNLDDDRFPSDEELHKQLMSKVPNPKANTSYTPTTNMIQESVKGSGGVNREEIKEMIEELVYEVLSDIIGEQNKNFDNKEQFKFLVGQTLFSGYIQKALPMPEKKKK